MVQRELALQLRPVPDPENTQFGDLRVFNDDRLIPGAIWPLHPHRDIEGITKDARVALTLRVVGGLTTEEIARALLVPVSSTAQRIVRAKRTLTAAHVRSRSRAGPSALSASLRSSR